LESGQSVLFYSARGPADPVLTTSRPFSSGGEAVGRQLGTLQGKLLRSVLEKTDVSRICVAGGDTSSYVMQQLGISAMTITYPLAPGAPLCRAHSLIPRFDGLELSLKGGQVGAADFFGRVRNGQ
jgi:3-oxoisoapionate kinase